MSRDVGGEEREEGEPREEEEGAMMVVEKQHEGTAMRRPSGVADQD